MNRRMLCVALIGCVLVAWTAIPAEARKKKKKIVRTERVIELPYTAAFGSPASGGGCLAAVNPCPTITLLSDEKFLQVEVADDSGTAAPFQVGQDFDGDGFVDQTSDPFCGSTGELPVEVDEGVNVVLFVWTFGDVDCPGGLGTQGTASITISNAP